MPKNIMIRGAKISVEKFCECISGATNINLWQKGGVIRESVILFTCFVVGAAPSALLEEVVVFSTGKRYDRCKRYGHTFSAFWL